jgi:hypothetical protein
MRKPHPDARSIPILFFASLILAYLFLPATPRAGWPVDGLPVCTEEGTQTGLQAVPDDMRGLFLVWMDYRDGQSRLYAQHVDGDGNVLWAENGVPLGDGDGAQSAACISTDGAGEPWIVWQEASGIYVEHLDAAGNPAFIDSGGLNAFTADNRDPVCSADGTGGIMLAWISEDAGGDAGVWVFRINAGGMWDFPQSWIRIGTDVAPDARLSYAANASPGDGILLGWEGVHGAYVQWVDASLTPRWGGPDGLQISGPLGTEDSIVAIVDRQAPSGGAYPVFEGCDVGIHCWVNVAAVHADGTVESGAGGLYYDIDELDLAGVEVVDNGQDGFFCVYAMEDLHYCPGNLDLFADNYDYDYAPLWSTQIATLEDREQFAGLDAALKPDTGDLFVGWQDGEPTDEGRLYHAVIDRATGGASERKIVSGAYTDEAPHLLSSGFYLPSLMSHPLATWVDARNPGTDIYANSLSTDWPDTNVIGLYTSDDPSTAVSYAHVPIGPLTLYLCVKHYRQDGPLSAWECLLEIPPGIDHMFTTYRGAGTNSVEAPAYQVVCGVPLPAEDFMVLAEIHLFNLGGPQALRLHPVAAPCLPGQMALISADEPGVCRPMEWASGDEDAPVFHINDPTVGVPGSPAKCLRLHANAPNPFNPRTTIRFDLPAAARVTLGVYDLAGRLVRVLRDGELRPAGRHIAAWDGRDDAGRAVPAGVYVCRLEAGMEIETRRMVLVR